MSLHQYAAAPAWSPDGSVIAFFGEAGISQLGSIYSQGNGIWIIGAQGQGVRQLISIDHVKNMAWSPDGQKLAFEIDLAPQGGSEIRIIESREGQEISRFSGQQPAWSPDSQQLVIKNCTPNCGLWRVNLDGGDGQQITLDSTDSYPAWSPNGQYVVFGSQRDNNWEIYRLRLSDGELRNLTSRPSTDTTPVFSPDGGEIYLRTDQPGDWWITAINLNGSRERPIWGGIGPSDDWGLARPAVY
jgi:TolB protein